MSQRRRSRDVALVVVPLLAAAVTGCGGNDTAYCVDQNNDVVENRNCDGLGNPGFFWYYGAGVGAVVWACTAAAPKVRVASAMSVESERVMSASFSPAPVSNARPLTKALPR